jgi:hypothetical protein
VLSTGSIDDAEQPGTAFVADVSVCWDEPWNRRLVTFPPASAAAVFCAVGTNG